MYYDIIKFIPLQLVNNLKMQYFRVSNWSFSLSLSLCTHTQTPKQGTEATGLSKVSSQFS